MVCMLYICNSILCVLSRQTASVTFISASFDTRLLCVFLKKIQVAIFSQLRVAVSGAAGFRQESWVLVHFQWLGVLMQDASSISGAWEKAKNSNPCKWSLLGFWFTCCSPAQMTQSLAMSCFFKKLGWFCIRHQDGICHNFLSQEVSFHWVFSYTSPQLNIKCSVLYECKTFW